MTRRAGVLVQVGVLGPLSVTVDGVDIRIGSRNQRCLLTALLVHAGDVVSTDTLIGALWGEEPPSTALESLRTYVYRLRETLGAAGDALVTRPPGYVLTIGDGQLDAHRFERRLDEARAASEGRARVHLLDDALELWRGQAFGEFAHEPFAMPEAVRLEERRCVAIEERCETLLRLADDADVAAHVAAELRGFVEQHPFRERAVAQLMVALYRAGRQADALAVCRSFRERSADELGLEVPQAISDLERHILRQATHLAAPAFDGAETTAAAAGPRTDAPSADRLPTDSGELFGRDDDLEAVRRHLAEANLVAITGPGGVGKTRLALRTARQEQTRHHDGVWWCELASLRGDDDVIEALATMLGIPATSERPLDTIVDHLGDREALLVLDNAEHVVDGLRPVVADITSRCPGIRLLVTSRTTLDVPDERVHRLAPLPTGGGDDAGMDDDGRDSPAMQLLVARARDARPDLTLDTDERRHLAAVCRRLDGVPLALELAASRLRALNPEDLERRLRGSLDLLAQVRPTGSRHDTLRSVIGWSYQLLSRHERRLFARVSVFAGPFTLEAAEHIGGGDGIEPDEVVDLLARLVDHSLVVIVPAGGPTRYAMLETLRTFGLERLDGTGDERRVRQRHAAYHLALAEDAATQVRSRDEAIGVRRLDRALDELRMVHRWVVQLGEVDLAVRLVLALFRYGLWRLRAEVLGWAAETAELTGADGHPDIAVVAGAAGWAAGLAGDLDGAARWAERGLAALADDRDPRALLPLEVRMHCALWQGHLDDCLVEARRAAAVTDDPYELVPRYVPGLALTYAGRADEAIDLLDEVQVAADRHGNPTMRSLVLYSRAEALLASDPDRAMRLLQEASTTAASVHNRMMLGVIDVSLVSLLARHGPPHDALRTFVSVIDRLEAGGDRTHLWTGIRWLVTLLVRVGREQEAAVLLGAVRTAASAPPPYGEDAERLDRHEVELRDRLGEDHLADLQARGRAMTDRQAIDLARDAASGEPVRPAAEERVSP